jgi:S-formylglutathione hydrolase FrmB
VYLFHGLRGDSGSWLDNSMLPVFARDYNAVFILPDAGRSFYADMKYGQNFFTWLSRELPGLCKRLFNITAKPADTAVIGCSLGGYGALKCALSYPGRYGFCGALDRLYPENIRFREDMEQLEFDFTFEEWEGGHDWEFFNEALKRALRAWTPKAGGQLA